MAVNVPLCFRLCGSFCPYLPAETGICTIYVEGWLGTGEKSQEIINIFKVKQEASQTLELLCHNLSLLFSSNPSLSLIYCTTHEPLTSHRVVLSVNVCPIITSQVIQHINMMSHVSHCSETSPQTQQTLSTARSGEDLKLGSVICCDRGPTATSGFAGFAWECFFFFFLADVRLLFLRICFCVIYVCTVAPLAEEKRLPFSDEYA